MKGEEKVKNYRRRLLSLPNANIEYDLNNSSVNSPTKVLSNFDNHRFSASGLSKDDFGLLRSAKSDSYELKKRCRRTSQIFVRSASEWQPPSNHQLVTFTLLENDLSPIDNTPKIFPDWLRSDMVLRLLFQISNETVCPFENPVTTSTDAIPPLEELQYAVERMKHEIIYSSQDHSSTSGTSSPKKVPNKTKEAQIISQNTISVAGVSSDSDDSIKPSSSRTKKSHIRMTDRDKNILAPITF